MHAVIAPAVLQRSEGRSEPKAEHGGMIVVWVQHRIHHRLVAQSHVHERKDWKSVEDLDVIFVMTSRVRRLDLRTKLGEADQNVVLNLTVKANTSSKVSVPGEASSTIGISAGLIMY